MAATAAVWVTIPILVFAQAARQDQPPVRPARGQAGATRPPLPPVGRGMNAMQLQQHLDAFALIQAEQQLKLSSEQYSVFAPKLVRMQTMRRRMMQERRRLLNDLNQLLIAEAPSDEAITEKTKAFDDVNRQGNDEVLKGIPGPRREPDALAARAIPPARGTDRAQETELLTKLGPSR
jgi:hypothetical protein